MGGKEWQRKKVVTQSITPDAQHQIDNAWAYEMSMRNVPSELNSYLQALRIACMNDSRRRYAAANKWASKAHERLIEVLETNPEIVAYIEPFDTNSIDDDLTELPRVRKRQSKAEIIKAVLTRMQ